jgi:hypothetical protein
MEQLANLKALVTAIKSLNNSGVDNKEALKTAVQQLGGVVSNNKAELGNNLLGLLLEKIGALDVDALVVNPQIVHVHQNPSPQDQPQNAQTDQPVIANAEGREVLPVVTSNRIQLRTNS